MTALSDLRWSPTARNALIAGAESNEPVCNDTLVAVRIEVASVMRTIRTVERSLPEPLAGDLLDRLHDVIKTLSPRS